MMIEDSLRPEQIRAARSLLSWSQQDLATRAGVAISTIADFERGQRNPIQNNVTAIRQALEAAGVVFTETGVSHGFHWVLMTEKGSSSLVITYAPGDESRVIELASIFGKVEPPKISIDRIQCATPELRSKVLDYVNRHGAKTLQLKRLYKMLADMPDGEFFLLLPTPPSSTEEMFHYERALHQLNHPKDKIMDESLNIFGTLLDQYDIFTPRTDKDTKIGNPQKDRRVCRFCGRSKNTGARFDKAAHAIPAALGNKYLKLADECDECNQYFGDNVEPTLVELLNIQRVFLGIEARGSLPSVQFRGGKMYNDNKNNLMVIVSEAISDDASGVLSAQLGSGKTIIPQNFYRALCKIALSVIPKKELPSLEKTIRWVRHGTLPELPELHLPTIATAVVMLPPAPSAQITLYMRKGYNSTMPHVVCEFRLGCYIYVYALPFSVRDEGSLVGFFDKDEFKNTFKHYAAVPHWSQQDYSGTQEIQVVQNIRLQPRDAV